MAAKTKKRWVPGVGAKLGAQEEIVRNKIKNEGGEASVYVLFREIGGNIKTHDNRMQQQRIGAIAARHNRKVKSPHIVVGDKPGTYRLKRVR